MNFLNKIFNINNTNQSVIPKFHEAGFQIGETQNAGALSMIPLLGEDVNNGISFLPPLSGIKVSKVKGYGNIELANNGNEGLAIVPLHIGYIQQGAQNHALCRSGFLAAGQKVFFKDACCVQESQGGYLQEKEQWFFILPIELRKKALELRGVEGYDKLWKNIASVNKFHGREHRGHLDEIVVKLRNELNIFSNRFEALDRQRGALFFIDGKYAGVEIAPTHEYFKEVFSPLLNFSYGPSAYRVEQHQKAIASTKPFEAKNLISLKNELIASREKRDFHLFNALAASTNNPVQLIPEEKFLNLELKTVQGNQLNGQVVMDNERLIYASVFSETFSIN